MSWDGRLGVDGMRRTAGHVEIGEAEVSSRRSRFSSVFASSHSTHFGATFAVNAVSLAD